MESRCDSVCRQSRHLDAWPSPQRTNNSAAGARLSSAAATDIMLLFGLSSALSLACCCARDGRAPTVGVTLQLYLPRAASPLMLGQFWAHEDTAAPALRWAAERSQRDHTGNSFRELPPISAPPTTHPNYPDRRAGRVGVRPLARLWTAAAWARPACVRCKR
jgi:hypothetical protein